MNGWKNRETWLVNLWYMDEMPDYYADSEQWYVDPSELRDTIEYIANEGEAMSQLSVGLLADFISGCFAEVDWDTLAKHLNAELEERYALLED